MRLQRIGGYNNPGQKTSYPRIEAIQAAQATLDAAQSSLADMKTADGLLIALFKAGAVVLVLTAPVSEEKKLG